MQREALLLGVHHASQEPVNTMSWVAAAEQSVEACAEVTGGVRAAAVPTLTESQPLMVARPMHAAVGMAVVVTVKLAFAPVTASVPFRGWVITRDGAVPEMAMVVGIFLLLIRTSLRLVLP